MDNDYLIDKGGFVNLQLFVSNSHDEIASLAVYLYLGNFVAKKILQAVKLVENLKNNTFK